MAKAIKVKEAFYKEAKKALEQAKITHSWDTHPNAHKTNCLIVRNKDKNAAIEAIKKALCEILSVHNRRHWEWICLSNDYWEWTN